MNDVRYFVKDLKEEWPLNSGAIFRLGIHEGAQFQALAFVSWRDDRGNKRTCDREIPIPVSADQLRRIWDDMERRNRSAQNPIDAYVTAPWAEDPSCEVTIYSKNLFVSPEEVQRLNESGIRNRIDGMGRLLPAPAPTRLSGAPPAPVEAAPQAGHGTSASEPPAAPVAHTPAPSASVAAPEPVADRDARRLREFEGLGGAVQIARDGSATLTGRQGALQELADRERAAGRPRSDRSDIGKALRAEAERRHKAQPG